MSKSLGNFFTIKEVLEKYDSEVLRFFLISSHYRSPVDFSDQNLSEAEAGLARIYQALAAIDETLKSDDETSAVKPALLVEAEEELRGKTASFMERFSEAMDDDFNTALALGNVFDLVRGVNRFLAEGGGHTAVGRSLLTAAKTGIHELGGVLGIFGSEPAAYTERIKARKVAELAIVPEEIERLIAERAAARKARDFKRSDEIRDMLLARGVTLLDGPEGTTWKVR
jgi:cysteinyl-tRNA synthetase